jgi:hypothetical protein
MIIGYYDILKFGPNQGKPRHISLLELNKETRKYVN